MNGPDFERESRGEESSRDIVADPRLLHQGSVVVDALITLIQENRVDFRVASTAMSSYSKEIETLEATRDHLSALAQKEIDRAWQESGGNVST